MNKLKSSSLLAILFFITALASLNANAAFISTEGDANSNLELETTLIQYHISLQSTYDFNQFFIPFASVENASQVIANFTNWECQTNNNYMLCISGINNLFNSISGYFTLPEGYEFGDLIGSRDSFFSADNLGNFESFTGYVPEIRQSVSNSVPTPESLGLLLLGLGCLAYSRREKTTKTNSKF